MSTVKQPGQPSDHVEIVQPSDLDSALEVTSEGLLANQYDHELTKWQAIQKYPLAVAWCIFAVWLVLMNGFENIAGGIIISVPEFRKDFGHYYEGNYVLPADWQSAFSGIGVAAAAIGAIAAGEITEWITRKWLFILSMVLAFVSITLEFIATTNIVFFMGKLLNGFSIGVINAIASTFIGENSPLPLRGILTAMMALAVNIGPLIVFIIQYYVGHYQNRWAYRSIFCAQYGVAFIGAVFGIFMPESPWYLCMKGKDDKALQALHRLGYRDGNDRRYLAMMKHTIAERARESENVTYLTCFRKSNLRRTILSVSPVIIQTLLGSGWVGSYTAYFLQLSGMSPTSSFRYTIGQQVLSIGGNIISWFVIDRFGRRDITVYGSAALLVVLILIGSLSAAGTAPTLQGTIAFLLFYAILFNSTVGSTAYTLLAEVATPKLRTKTVAIGLLGQNGFFTMWAFVLPYLFNPDRANLGGKTAFVFVGCGVLSVIFLWFYLPETAGRTFVELDEMFAKGVPARKFKHYIPVQQELSEAAASGKEGPVDRN